MPHRDPADGPDESDGDSQSHAVSRRSLLQATAGAGVGAVALGYGLSGDASAGIPTPELHRDGNLLKDPSGNTVTLRGVNIADPKRINVTSQARGKTATDVVDMLTDESSGWYSRAIRIPVQPVDIGEYEPGSGPPVPAFDESQLESYLSNHLDEVVQRCAERGVYAIVDYHRHRDVRWAEGQDGPVNAALQDEVDMFWDTVAPRYANDSHVLYEVYNEPTEPGMWADPTEQQWVEDIWRLWLDMAQPWVDTIRSHAGNVILMGSPSWTQSPEGALVEEFDGSDIAYTYHIYPGHNSSQSNDWEDASSSNNGEGVEGVYEQAPLFVTEWGWERNAGQYIGGTDSGYGEPFFQFLQKSDAISWTAWCADPVWRPVMFDRPFADDANDSVGDPYNGTVPTDCESLPCEWSLTTGGGYMGDNIKQWLSDLRDDNVPDGGTEPPEPTESPTDTETATETETETETETDTPTEEPPSGDPIASIDPSTTSASTGELVQFWLVDETGGGSWVTGADWDLGNGETGSGWYADVRYQSAGSYTVSMTATDDEGNQTTDEVTIDVS